MAHQTKPLPIADPDYDQRREHLFRRQLEAEFSKIWALLDGVASGTDTIASLQAKVGLHVGLPVGVVQIPPRNPVDPS